MRLKVRFAVLKPDFLISDKYLTIFGLSLSSLRESAILKTSVESVNSGASACGKEQTAGTGVQVAAADFLISAFQDSLWQRSET